MSVAKTSSLKPLIYVGMGILGFGLFLLVAMWSEVTSPYANWSVITIVSFPLTVGSFLIVIGMK